MPTEFRLISYPFWYWIHKNWVHFQLFIFRKKKATQDSKLNEFVLSHARRLSILSFIRLLFPDFFYKRTPAILIKTSNPNSLKKVHNDKRLAPLIATKTKTYIRALTTCLTTSRQKLSRKTTGILTDGSRQSSQRHSVHLPDVGDENLNLNAQRAGEGLKTFVSNKKFFELGIVCWVFF